MSEWKIGHLGKPPSAKQSVLGLDLSLTATGLAVLCKDRSYQVITIRPKSKKRHRLNEISAYVQEAIDEFNIVFAVVEGYAMNPRAGSRVFHIGELGGVVRADLLMYGLAFAEIAPTSLKKFVTGRARAPKNAMKKAVLDRWNVEIVTDDEADAYGLARIGAVHKGLISTQKDLQAVNEIEFKIEE